MSEARRRRRAHQDILDNCPYCIYCGGDEFATTVEHMPPRMMFKKKERPKGLEFASCKSCNEGTRHADLVASLMGRIYPDATTELEKSEYKDLLKAVNNNIPGLLPEMWIGHGGQKIARKRLPPNFGNGGVLRVNGPLLSAHMEAFAAKIGFSFHYEATGEIISSRGGVFARWYTNIERYGGNFPDELVAMLPAPLTLKQGKKQVSDQFQYSFAVTTDKSNGAFVATFRHAFAVAAISAADRRFLDKNCPFPELVWEPGEIITRLMQAVPSMSA